MSTQTSGWQGAKRSRGGTTASIRNADRRAFAYSPFGLTRDRAPCVVAQSLRGATTLRSVRLAWHPISGQCEASFSVNRP